MTRATRRPVFTLFELLVVIAIIAILITRLVSRTQRRRLLQLAGIISK